MVFVLFIPTVTPRVFGHGAGPGSGYEKRRLMVGGGHKLCFFFCKRQEEGRQSAKRVKDLPKHTSTNTETRLLYSKLQSAS